MMQAPVSVLRKYVRPRDADEKCDACGAALPADHAHQFDPRTRRVHCACASCALLYGNVYRDIPRHVQALPQFCLSDTQWDSLVIPISLAFFTCSSAANKMVALYPGPAGAAESLLPLDAWRDIVEGNPSLKTMQPDVEALLVNRVGETRDYFIVPIDQCYKLVGLIRLHWRGLSGGSLVWGEVSKFFDGLRRKAEVCRS